MRYAGVCYDGPWEGKSHDNGDRPHFKLAITPSLSFAENWMNSPSVKVDFKEGWYHWQRDLRKWVWQGP